MSFRLFIYYCALGGGWAAFLAWGLLAIMGVATVVGKSMGQVVLIGGFLGLFVAFAIGLVDGILNSTGKERYLRASSAAASASWAGPSAPCSAPPCTRRATVSRSGW